VIAACSGRARRAGGGWELQSQPRYGRGVGATGQEEASSKRSGKPAAQTAEKVFAFTVACESKDTRNIINRRPKVELLPPLTSLFELEILPDTLVA